VRYFRGNHPCNGFFPVRKLSTDLPVFILLALGLRAGVGFFFESRATSLQKTITDGDKTVLSWALKRVS
jgi:hypothetical protein